MDKFDDRKAIHDDEDLEDFPSNPTPWWLPFGWHGKIMVVSLVLFTLALIFYLAIAVTRPKSSDVSSMATPLDEDRAPQIASLVQMTQDSGKSRWEIMDKPLENCGTTVSQAMANGCPFDVMSNLWTPSLCYNSSLALEALSGLSVGSQHGGVGAPEFGLEKFKWFEDEKLSISIKGPYNLEQFLAARNRDGLPLEAYTHMSFHAAHCSYLARVATWGLDRVVNGETNVWVPIVATDPSHARHCEHVFGELYRLPAKGARRNWTEVGFGIAPCVRIA